MTNYDINYLRVVDKTTAIESDEITRLDNSDNLKIVYDKEGLPVMDPVKEKDKQDIADIKTDRSELIAVENNTELTDKEFADRIKDKYRSNAYIKNGKVFVNRNDIVRLEDTALHSFEALKEIVKDKCNIDIRIRSGFRTEKAQLDARSEYTNPKLREKYCAEVGHSEHHTGLAVDIAIDVPKEIQEKAQLQHKSSALKYRAKRLVMASTKCLSKVLGTPRVYDAAAEYKFKAYDRINEICADYGFILSYPKHWDSKIIQSKKPVYEPWHFRFVGRTAAKTIAEQKITLKQYVEKLKEPELEI